MVDLFQYKRRFKGFWDEFKKSKQGLIGIVIIILFAVIAVIAPIFAPGDPMYPVMLGYYPGSSPNPQVAEAQCLPIWYKQLPGGQNLSENLMVVPEHEFSSQEDFEKWSVPPNAMYDSTMGTRNGCIKIAWESGTGNSEERTIILSRKFEYPYNNPPRAYWIHISAFLGIEDIEEEMELKKPVPIVISLGNTTLVTFDARSPSNQTYYANLRQKDTYAWNSDSWLLRIAKNPWVQEEVREALSSPGNYSLNLEVTVNKNDTGGHEPTVYVDDVQFMCYGDAYGLLGTDAEKDHPKDLFAMCIHGTRISFMVGLLAAFFSVFIGLSIGLVAGYLRGIIDEALMRVADLLMVLPTLPLMIVLVIVLGPSIWNIIGILIFMGWMGFSRTVRSMVLSIRERQFVEAAKASGAGKFYIIQRHILPNIFALVYISLAVSVPGAIISEASLAWLGLGDPTIPSWGNIFYNYRRAAVGVSGLQSWYWVLPPGVAITLLAMSFILIGFSLDEIFNPKLRRRR